MTTTSAREGMGGEMGIDDGWSKGGRCYERLRRTIGPDFGDGVLDAIDRRDTELARVEADRDAALAKVEDAAGIMILLTHTAKGCGGRDANRDCECHDCTAAVDALDQADMWLAMWEDGPNR